MDIAHALPAELTIYAVAAQAESLRSLLAAGAFDDGGAVDGSAVAEADGPGVQLLLSLRASLAARGLPLRVHAPSERLAAACATLGVADLGGVPS